MGQMLDTVLVSSGIEVVGSAESLADLGDVDPGVIVVVAITAASTDEVARVAALTRRADAPRLVAICPAVILPNVGERMGSAIHALLPDDVDVETITLTVRLVGRGYRVTPDSIPELPPRARANGHEAAHLNGDARERFDQLTPREVAILHRLCEGMENKRIARDLDISEATVKVHLRALYRKIGANNRTQAALWGADNLHLLRSGA